MRKFLKAIIAVFIVYYVVLVCVHFFNARALWNDEACILNNIQNLKPVEIFNRPLLSDQAFPRLYLWGIQQFSHLFNHHVLSLRFFPLLCMLFAFALWMRIMWRNVLNPIDRINFLLCWLASIPLIYYAAELKQYSMDVLVGAVLVWMMLRTNDAKWDVRLWCLFPLLGFFSYIAFFLMLVPVLILWRHKKILAAYFLVCLSMALYLWYFDARISATHLLETYWHEYFISFKSIPDFLSTLFEGINNLIARWFVELPKVYRAIARFFVGLGFIFMFGQGFQYFNKKQARLTIPVIAFIIFIELVILGVLRKFPFTVPRMSLFFAPMLLWVMVEVFAWVRGRWPKAYWVLQILFWIYMAVMSVGIAREVFHGDLGAQSTIWQNH